MRSDYDFLLLVVSWLVLPSISVFPALIASVVTQNQKWATPFVFVNLWVLTNCLWMLCTLIAFVWRNR
jgi:hypothetical protein